MRPRSPGSRRVLASTALAAGGHHVTAGVGADAASAPARWHIRAPRGGRAPAAPAAAGGSCAPPAAAAGGTCERNRGSDRRGALQGCRPRTPAPPPGSSGAGPRPQVPPRRVLFLRSRQSRHEGASIARLIVWTRRPWKRAPGAGPVSAPRCAHSASRRRTPGAGGGEEVRARRPLPSGLPPHTFRSPRMRPAVPVQVQGGPGGPSRARPRRCGSGEGGEGTRPPRALGTSGAQPHAPTPSTPTPHPRGDPTSGLELRSRRRAGG